MSILVVLVLVLLSTLAPRLGTELRATTPARRDRLITLSRRVGRPCARGPPARPIGFDRDGRRHEPHRLHHLRRHHAERASPSPPKHQHLSHRAVVAAAVPTRRVSPAALPRARAWETRCPSAWRSAVRRSGDQLSVYEEILLSLDIGADGPHATTMAPTTGTLARSRIPSCLVRWRPVRAVSSEGESGVSGGVQPGVERSTTYRVRGRCPSGRCFGSRPAGSASSSPPGQAASDVRA